MFRRALVATFFAGALASTIKTEILARANSGTSSFYGGNLDGGNCLFTGYSLPSDTFGTALSNARWDSAGKCGACVSVKGPNGNTIKAMVCWSHVENSSGFHPKSSQYLTISIQVVDKCPECDSNKLDLFQNAFEQIGDTSDGIIDITWDFVSCGITTPLTVRNKSGTSAY